MSTLTAEMVVVGLQSILGPQVAVLALTLTTTITGDTIHTLVLAVGLSDQLGQTLTGVEEALHMLAEARVVLLHRCCA